MKKFLAATVLAAATTAGTVVSAGAAPVNHDSEVVVVDRSPAKAAPSGVATVQRSIDWF